MAMNIGITPPSIQRYVVSALIAALIAAFLSACSILPQKSETIEQPVIREVAVNQKALLSLINAYRSENGLHALEIDQTLNRVSVDMAFHIAKRDSMDTWAHSDFGLSSRLDKADYKNYAAAENLGAGYADLQAAFDGWKGSAGHNKNLLNPYVTQIGIGRTVRLNGKWRNFWALTLARPESAGRPDIRQ